MVSGVAFDKPRVYSHYHDRVYDLLIFIHGQNNQFLERQIKVFVVTSLIFIVIIYFVYAISLPQGTAQQF